MSSQTNMPQHGKNFMCLTVLDMRIPTKHQQSLPHQPLFHKKERCPQFLIHRIFNLSRRPISNRSQGAHDTNSPLLSRLIQGYLDHTGIEACPYVIRWITESRTRNANIVKEPWGCSTTIESRVIVTYRFSPSTFLVHTPTG